MRRPDLLILAGALILASGLLILVSWPISEKSWPSMLMITGTGIGFLVGGFLWRHRSGDGPEQDERTDGITSAGFRYSWYVTFAGMLLLASIGPFIPLDAPLNLYIAIVLMVASAIAFQGYLSLRGDEW
ncbi:hypothetical protein [Methanofollis fontis]|uniref:DUF2178 domain-containing protein n=1 Tax=Methanofollis fontis TaxID=2052832 RepID=A0A483CRD3_9EURY|nr:hypothetical protein [Methanofollis fontis]TAJ45675.1 hypothetical protein CUJ86_02875 [Methanofollis fontis]